MTLLRSVGGSGAEAGGVGGRRTVPSLIQTCTEMSQSEDNKGDGRRVKEGGGVWEARYNARGGGILEAERKWLFGHVMPTGVHPQSWPLRPRGAHRFGIPAPFLFFLVRRGSWGGGCDTGGLRRGSGAEVFVAGNPFEGGRPRAHSGAHRMGTARTHRSPPRAGDVDGPRRCGVNGRGDVSEPYHWSGSRSTVDFQVSQAFVRGLTCSPCSAPLCPTSSHLG